jgi:hypothetical protein
MAKFPNQFWVILVALLCVSDLPGQEQAERQKADRTRTATTFIQLLDRGDFDKAVTDVDSVMLKVMPADKLKTTWEMLLSDAGTYKKPLDTRIEAAGIYQIVHVTCEFAKRKIDVRVVFNRKGKISGLQFRNPPMPKPKGAEEIWEGMLKAGVIELRLVFHLFKDQDGNYGGTMDSPDQGAKGIVLDEVRIKDDAVRLELKSAAMIVEGKLTKDGQEIKGHFKQAGKDFPLTLQRMAKAREVRRTQTPQDE